MLWARWRLGGGACGGEDLALQLSPACRSKSPGLPVSQARAASRLVTLENGGGFSVEEALGLKRLFRVSGPKLIFLVPLQGGARV